MIPRTRLSQLYVYLIVHLFNSINVVWAMQSQSGESLRGMSQAISNVGTGEEELSVNTRTT
jgi:hypothetical protein